jgi:hypothetical protein
MPNRVPRNRILGAALALAAVVLATLTYVQHAMAGPAAVPGATPVSGAPTPPSPGPTASQPPAEACAADAMPAHLPVALRADADEVTCKFRASQVTITWDGTNITIAPAAKRKFGNLRCALDPATVKVIEPQGAKVYKDGSIDVPYDRTANNKITIKIKYTVECPADGFTTTINESVTIEFTPPDGPVVVRRETP